MVTVANEREQYGEQRLRSLGWFRDRVVFLVRTNGSRIRRFDEANSYRGARLGSPLCSKTRNGSAIDRAGVVCDTRHELCADLRVFSNYICFPMCLASMFCQPHWFRFCTPTLHKRLVTYRLLRQNNHRGHCSYNRSPIDNRPTMHA